MRKPFVNRLTGQLITSRKDLGDGTVAVTYLDDGTTDTLAAGDCYTIVNGYQLLRPEDRTLALHVAIGNLVDIVDRAGTKRTKFATFADMEAWSARNGIAPNGWAPDVFGFTTWLPVGHRFAGPDAAQPCMEYVHGQSIYGHPCPRPGTPLCKIHTNAANKRAASQARWAEESRARHERWDAEKAAGDAAAMWAARIADEFGIASTPSSRGLIVNPEGLYGLLAAAAAELWGMEMSIDDICPRELRPILSTDS